MIEPIEIESFDYNYVYLGTYICLRVGNVNLEMWKILLRTWDVWKILLHSFYVITTHCNFSWETRNQGILWQEISHKKNRQEKQEIDEGKKGT